MNQPKRKSIAGPMHIPMAQPTAAASAGPMKKTNQEQESSKGPGETGGFKKSKGPKDTTTIEGRALITGSAECTVDQLCCQYNEDYTMYAGGGVDGNLKIFDTATNELLMTLSDNEVQGRTSSVTCVKHRPVTKNYPINNCFTSTYVNGLVKCWNYNFKQCIYTIRENRQTYGLAYHPKLPKFITYGDNLKIYLYDEETRVQERVLQASDRKESHDGPISRVFAGRFNPRSNYEFLTGGWDDLVHLWDLRAPHAVKHLSGVHLCGEGLDINRKGTEILTCSWRKEEQLQLWDYASFKMISTFYPDVYPCKLYCGRFINADYLCCCGGDPNLVRVVDLQTSYSAVIVNSLPSAAYHLNIGPTKSDGTVKPLVEEDTHQKLDISRIPKLIYTCGRKLIQLDFVCLRFSIPIQRIVNLVLSNFFSSYNIGKLKIISVVKIYFKIFTASLIFFTVLNTVLNEIIEKGSFHTNNPILIFWLTMLRMIQILSLRRDRPVQPLFASSASHIMGWSLLCQKSFFASLVSKC